MPDTRLTVAHRSGWVAQKAFLAEKDHQVVDEIGYYHKQAARCLSMFCSAHDPLTRLCILTVPATRSITTSGLVRNEPLPWTAASAL